MIKSFRRCLAALMLGAVVLALLLTLPASANPGLSVSGALMMADVSPGQTLTWPITVSFAADDPAADMVVQVMGINQSLSGVNDALAGSEDTYSYSARSFITINKSSFHLEPGVPQNLTATIQIPSDIGAGGRYAIINVATQPAAGSTGVSFVAAVNVPIVLTIKGSQLVHTGKITSLSTGNITSGQPVQILTDFQNTGNHHFKVKGEVAVSNSQGQIMGTVAVPLTASSVLPGMTRRLQAAFIPQGELAAGKYAISAKVMLEDGTVLDTVTGSFEVKQAYVPPTGTVAALSPTAPAASLPASIAAAASTPAATATTGSGGGMNSTVIIGIAAGVIIVVLLALLFRRRGG